MIVTQFLGMATAAFQHVVMKSCAALEAYHTLLVLDKRKSLRATVSSSTLCSSDSVYATVKKKKSKKDGDDEIFYHSVDVTISKSARNYSISDNIWLRPGPLSLVEVLRGFALIGYAIKTQLKAPMPSFRFRGIYCFSLCLYGIRVASIARKEFIIDAHKDTAKGAFGALSCAFMT